jgi:autotransporter-associated beta strand protein
MRRTERRVGRIRSLCHWAMLSVMLGVTASVSATPYTWDGGTSATVSWSDPANWTPDGVPASGSTTAIIFNGVNNRGSTTTPLNVDIANPFVLNSLSFTAGANQAYYLGGNPLQFVADGTTQPVLGNSGANNKTFSNNILIPASTTLNLANDTYNLYLLGVISGDGGLTMNARGGGGQWYISGANTYTGGTVYNGTGNASQGYCGLYVSASGGLGTGPVTLNGGSTAVPGGNPPSGLYFTGGNTTYANNFVLLATSPIYATGSNVALSGSFNLNDKTLYLRGSGSATISGPISGSGGIIKNDAGNWTLSGNNDYSGKTAINAGRIILNSDSRLGTNPASLVADQLALNGGSLQATAGFALGSNRGVTIGASGGTIQVDSGDLTIGSGLTGSGAFTKSGVGRLILSTANPGLTGTFSVTAGALRITNAGALGATAANTSVASGAALELQGNFDLSEPLTISGEGIGYTGAVRNLSGNHILSGPVTIVGGYGRFNGIGGSTMTITGGISGANQTLRLDNSGIVVTTNPVNLGTGTLLVSNGASTINVLGNTWGTIQADYSGIFKPGLDGVVPVNTVVVLGNLNGNTIGTFDLNGTNQTVAALMSATGNTNAANSIVTNSGSTLKTLTVNNANAYTYAGKTTGNLALTKEGAGTLRLTGNSIGHAGTTAVNAGTLLIDGTMTSGSGPVTVAAGGILGGSGDINRDVQLSGILAPGASAGILHTNTITFAPSSTFRVELGGLEVGQYDQLDVTGGVNLGAQTANLDLILGFDPGPGGQFLLINNDGVDAINGAFAGIPEGSSVLFSYGGDNYRFQASYLGGDGNDFVLTSVPEPSAWLLVTLGAFGLLAIARRRGSQTGGGIPRSSLR